MTQADHDQMEALCRELAQGREESARAREESAKMREVIAEHGMALRMLPCAGHEIRIGKMEASVSRIYGAGAVISLLVLVVSTIAGAWVS